MTKSSSINSRLFFIKILGISLSVLMIMNFLFMMLRKIPLWFFWSIVVFCAVMAFFGIPFLRRMK